MRLEFSIIKKVQAKQENNPIPEIQASKIFPSFSYKWAKSQHFNI
jgi:hypothetical protein